MPQMKRPAAAPRASAAAGSDQAQVLKRPAGWRDWAASSSEPDTSGITAQQRHVLSKIEADLPEDIKEDLNKLRDDTSRGIQKKRNTQMNALVPNSMAESYSDRVTVDKQMIERFRAYSIVHRQGAGEVGFTHTEIIGPGKLGSEELLQQGLRAGHVRRRMVNGCELFFMKRGHDFIDNVDCQERRVRVTGSIQDKELMENDCYGPGSLCR